MVSLYKVAKPIVAPLARLYWRPTITGANRIPRTGPVIVASNHLSLADSFVIPMASRRMVRFIARADLWQKPGIKGWIMREFFTAIGTVPVEREAVRSAQGALGVALEVLRDGEVFGIYPEGTRSRDGRLYKGHTGVAWLAIQSGAPVIPVGLRGTDRLFRKGSILPRRPDLRIAFGEPVDFSHIPADASDGARRRLMTAAIMDAIAELSGQERAGSLNSPRARAEAPDASAVRPAAPGSIPAPQAASEDAPSSARREKEGRP